MMCVCACVCVCVCVCVCCVEVCACMRACVCGEGGRGRGGTTFRIHRRRTRECAAVLSCFAASWRDEVRRCRLPSFLPTLLMKWRQRRSEAITNAGPWIPSLPAVCPAARSFAACLACHPPPLALPPCKSIACVRAAAAACRWPSTKGGQAEGAHRMTSGTCALLCSHTTA